MALRTSEATRGPHCLCGRYARHLQLRDNYERGPNPADACHTGTPPSRFTDYAVEAKYDGQRGVAVVDGDAVTLLSRNGANNARTFPEIAQSR